MNSSILYICLAAAICLEMAACSPLDDDKTIDHSPEPKTDADKSANATVSDKTPAVNGTEAVKKENCTSVPKAAESGGESDKNATSAIPDPKKVASCGESGKNVTGENPKLEALRSPEPLKNIKETISDVKKVGSEVKLVKHDSSVPEVAEKKKTKK